MRVIKSTVAVLTVGVALLAGIPAQAVESECRGEKRQCEALITPEITVVEVISTEALEVHCGFGAKGCAKITANFETCTVYVKRSAGAVARLHEMNHCLGWNHVGAGKRANRKPWVPFEAVERWLENSPSQ